MEESTIDVKKSYLNHQDTCWKEYINYRKTKDKIVFFIGTLFITVMFGSGILIYKSYFPEVSPSNVNVAKVLNRLYVIQYVMMHFFFFLLYLYYTYNNVKEKIFLIESQCCQYKYWEKFGTIAQEIPVSVSLIKRQYIDTKLEGFSITGGFFKYVGNIFLFIIYCLFSVIPLFFKNDFIIPNPNGTEPEFKMKVSYLIIGALGIGALIFVRSMSTSFIKKMKIKILESWKIDPKEASQII